MKHILHQRLHFSTNDNFFNIAFLLLLGLISSCTPNIEQKQPESVSEVQLVPAPAKLLYKRGLFKLEKTTRLLMNLSDSKSKNIGEHFLASLQEKTSYKLKIADRFTTSKIKSSIEIIIEQVNLQEAEGFKIEIRNDKIKIFSSSESGLFYAVNTLISLIHKPQGSFWQTPQLVIEDYPSNKVRGLLLELDSLPLSKNKLIKLFQKNRINLVATNKLIANNSTHIGVIKLDAIEFAPSNLSISIESFYENASSSDTILFKIKNPAQLHPDSVAIIGEAMWSKATRRSYKRLVNHLNSEAKN